MKKKETYFAPAERLDKKEIRNQFENVINKEYINDLLDGLPYIALLLNYERQLIFGNNTLLESLHIKELKEILGQRPGELLNCIHADEGPNGCGTANACKVCKAVQVVLESQKQDKKITKDCRITSNINGIGIPFDLRITSKPVKINNEKFSLVSIQDISSEKRRYSLERIFFHDVINTAEGLKGFIDYLKTIDDPKAYDTTFATIEKIVDNLIDEILLQSDISEAEKGDLKVNKEKTSTKNILEIAANNLQYHNVAKNKEIKIDKCPEIDFTCDEILLLRSLGNLIKNALEEIEENEEIKIGCSKNKNALIFYVNNKGKIQEDIRLQIFQRSFSTKGKNRGLGTYSVKLIVEKYLNGKVYFNTSQKDGTTFFIEIPF